MRYEHTPALTIALHRAAGYARHDGAAGVAPRHLLLGLVGEEEGRPAVVLAQGGVSRAALRDRLGLLEDAPTDAEELPLESSTHDILARAVELAAYHSEEGSLATEHVLAAILEASADLRSQLERLGLDLNSVRADLPAEGPPIVLDEPLDLGAPTEAIDLARILDAAANRCREALRVLEDHCRFVVNDPFLSSRLKQLRHDLAAALSQLPHGYLLAARDTLNDVGTGISTAREWQRDSLAAVVEANARRLQEALRSLEEYGKVVSAEFAQAVEKLRYDSYTLERALALGQPARSRLAHCKLYVLVTESLCRASLLGTVREAVAGGAQVIQLREKTLDDRRLLELAREVRRITREHGALFIVNDRPDIALLAEADGVHLGQDDLPLSAVRRLLGPAALIGVSTHDLEQLRRAVLEGASYVGVGPTFPSRTKDFGKLAGLEFVRQAAAETSLPAFVLGGVTLDNVGDVLAAGGKRAAVGHAICAAEDPRWAAAEFCKLLQLASRAP